MRRPWGRARPKYAGSRGGGPEALRASDVLASMGSVAGAYDNALAETFFATLKTEHVHARSCATRHEVESEVFAYIEGLLQR